MASLIHKLSLHIIFYLLVVIFECNCSQTTKSKKYIRVIHIDSPKSPMHQPELTNFERIKRLGAISDARMHHIAEKTTNMSRYRELDVISPKLKLQDTQYYVEVGLGLFNNGEHHKIYLLFDTGAELTWTQCDGCTDCFEQSSPLFPKDKSETYRPYGQNDCPGFWIDDHCLAWKSYVGGTEIKGDWAREMLTVAGVYPHSEDVVKEFSFVCATETANFISEDYPNNVITGVLGMGNGKFSLMSQWGKNKFAYCIQEVDFEVHHESAMLLRFGDNVEEPPNMFVTPLLKVGNSAYYYLKLHDISVNGVKLNIPHDLFAIKPDNTGGTIIDSAAFYTHLVPEAYTILEDAITKFITENSFYLTKYPNPSDIGAEACWEPTIEANHVLPSVTFHFEGDADLFVKPSQVFLTASTPELPPPGFYYLTIRRGDINVIGSMHQFNHLMVFDVQNSKFSFAIADCADRD
ncbi:hypothetical protein RND81_08G019500 [Saponaria officinalis]|uniref:Peptidase A1 domain-containing protein n=1 Tax=Saponaria officinalis TaxID=3572 RepID=A0AAW1J2S7_SAPOF